MVLGGFGGDVAAHCYYNKDKIKNRESLVTITGTGRINMSSTTKRMYYQPGYE